MLTQKDIKETSVAMLESKNATVSDIDTLFNCTDDAYKTMRMNILQFALDAGVIDASRAFDILQFIQGGKIADEPQVQPNDKMKDCIIRYKAEQQGLILNKFKIGRMVCGAEVVSHTFSDGEGIIIFDRSIESIEPLAFQDESYLREIKLPPSVKKIGAGAFEGCSHLTHVNIPEHVTFIGHTAFYGCQSLKEITIPLDVREIGSDAFIHCPDLSVTCLPHIVPTTYYGSAGNPMTGVHEIFVQKSAARSYRSQWRDVAHLIKPLLMDI